MTNSLPKCLVPIGGEPLVEHWLRLLARHGIDEVLLNVSHHVDLVERYLGERAGRSPAVTLVVEAAPSGTAGTVRRERAFVAGEPDFWVCYADNLTDADLGAMRRAHLADEGAIMTVALFRAPNPRAAGIVEVDARGRITSFVEKPAHPASDLANAGIYLARREVLDELPAEPEALDFGHDVLPRLAGRLHGHLVSGFLADIGTLEALERARVAWAARGGRA